MQAFDPRLFALHPSAHLDTFARDNLPARAQWPDLLFTLPELQYPARLNCAAELVDAHVRAGRRDRVCLVAPAGQLTYAELAERVNRIANVLVRDLGLVPGNRVLLRGPNHPMLVAALLAVIKAGGVAVPTMPLLHAGELAYPLTRARVGLALCDARLADEMEAARARAPALGRVVTWGDGGAGSLERLMAQPGYASFAACPTASYDVCLIAFTSGTSGEPKGTMHFHRDLLAVCDSYGRHVLAASSDDCFIGSPPLGFAFGLGGLVLFPLRIGAAAILIEQATPTELAAAIAAQRATVCFTAPTAYRAMLRSCRAADLASLRKCVSAGEPLPAATFSAWRAVTGLRILDGLGSTEMLHIVIGSPAGEVRPGAIGRPVPGYEARVIDAHGREVPPGTLGRLAVRGPTGCRYLGGDRQGGYVQNGWNITGDACRMDADGYVWYQARCDDMIVSSGYNIAAPEVEAALMTHPAVAECIVVGTPDSDRGQIVSAYVVLRPGLQADGLARVLQDHVKATIAPYKYPRRVEFVHGLPKTPTGKLQRFALRQQAIDKRAPA